MVQAPERGGAVDLAALTVIERAQAAIEESQILFEVARNIVCESQERIARSLERRDPGWRRG